MVSYKITFRKSVEKDLGKIDKSEIKKILSVIEKLSEEPYPYSSCKLVGSEKTFRARIGNYRILYIVDEPEKEIEIQKVRHRKDVYR